MSDEELAIVAIPPLVSLLLHYEKQKGTPLTEEEVIKLRDKAVCMTMDKYVAAELAVKRGYDDISLEDPWGDWERLRPNLL